MTRTTKALKRLGVAGVAAATIGAGVPAFFATAAMAADVTSVTLTPDAVTAPAGTCSIFTIQASPAQVTTVDVQLAPRTASQDVAFCTLSADGTTSTTTTNVGGAGAVETAEFQTDATGKATFGVINSAAGAVDVTAFVETPTTPNNPGNGNGIPNSGEPQDTSVLTTTAGGANAVTTVDATPNSETAVTGETRTFTVVAKDANGNPVPGAQISFDVTAGPDNAAYPPTGTTCGTTDQTGTVTCSVQNTGGPGTDTIVAWVNRTDLFNAAARTTAREADEPSDTITKTFQAAPPAGATLAVTCGDNQVNAAGTSCQQPTSDGTAVFTGTVKTAAGAPIAGAIVRFAVTTGGTPDPATPADTETVSPTSCTTGADGTCTTTMTDTNPTDGETVTVTGTLAGATVATTAAATVTFHNPTAAEARTIDLTPASATNTVGNVQLLTATVKDRFGNPVQGASVTFTESGTGRFTNGASQVGPITTDAKGQATAEVTTQSNESPGQETVTASLPTTAGADECESLANATTAGGTTTAGAGNCTDSSTVNWVSATATPSPSSSTTPPSGRQALALVVNTPTINAGTQGKMTVTGSANQAIQLVCYTRPSTTYKVARNATINAAGDPVVFTLSLGMNTRCFAQYATNSAQDASPSGVINVKTVVSIFVVRNATRDYTFQGHNLPKYAGQLITLYYVNSNGDNVRKGFVKTDSTGIYHIPVKFVSNGTFTFFVRTGQTLTNAAGESNHVSVSIH